MDPTSSAVVHQDGKNNREWETNWVTGLLDQSAVHHATNSIMHNLVKQQWFFKTETKFSEL